MVEDYWADTQQTRREKLMPFFWSTIKILRGNYTVTYGQEQCGYTCEPVLVFLS